MVEVIRYAHSDRLIRRCASKRRPLNQVLGVMDPSGIYEVQVALMGVIGSLWELWLGGTFALIVAFHVGRDSLNVVLLIVGCLIYLAACVSISFRYIAYTSAFVEFNTQLEVAGFDPFPSPEWFGVYNSLVTIGTFLLGTVATVAFAVIQYNREMRRNA